jgi:hypothetical protein
MLLQISHTMPVKGKMKERFYFNQTVNPALCIVSIQQLIKFALKQAREKFSKEVVCLFIIMRL